MYSRALTVAFSCLVFILTSFSQGIQPGFTKLPDGIIVKLKSPAFESARIVRLQVITDHIIRVTASPLDTFSTEKSLMISGKTRKVATWRLAETANELTLATAEIKASINKQTAEISFTDKTGKPILREGSTGAKSFREHVLDGSPSYEVAQSFHSPADEAFYGLGQHQNGIMNYRNTQVDLVNYNSVIAIPFLVSSKNYGILWDNYSITKVVDTREFDPLSTMKLFSKEGDQGWLTASYTDRKDATKIISRAESFIEYNDIPALKDLPKGVNLNDVNVTWEGAIATDFTGLHTLYLKAAGYVKLWIGDSLVADKWRQSWNTGTVLAQVYLKKGEQKKLRMEWNPDGGESYISLKWMSPLRDAQKNRVGFKSEAGNQLDYYFVYGQNLDEVIAGYRELTGKATMLPKWAFGFWQSRERYKTQDEILSTVREFRKRKIPLDNIVEDWSYWEQDKWGSQDFDVKRFPDVAGMIKTLHEEYNTQFMISVWPKFYEGIEIFKTFNDSGWLYKRNIVNANRDWIGKGYTSSFYDAFNANARKGFWNLLNNKLYSKGVDAWWLDATEPDIHSNLSVAQRKELMGPTAIGPAAKYFNAFALQNAKGIYEGQRETNPAKRVFILTRSAYAGLQRYAAATWSGDIGSRWEDFKNQIPAGLNYSLSGLPYWTTDIGGFSVEKRYEDAKGEVLEEWREQMTRWYQFGAFCPLFRVHGQYPFREIYNTAPEDHEAYKSMLYYNKLRYRLMPYIYSVAGEVYHHDYTMMRALAMDFPTDLLVKNLADQYLFGPSILVAPVTDYRARSRRVYLPANNGWYDVYDGKFLRGGQTITADAPLMKMPLFIREGSIVPVGPELQYTAEKSADTITLYVYGGKDASFTLYEDEATNYNYEKGQFATIDFKYNAAAQTLTAEDRKGNFAGMLKTRLFNIVYITNASPQAFEPGKNVPVKSMQYIGRKITVGLK
ncbi:MAG: glycoside hydrolase family 31 protein [Ferruginibacter sp.]|nr:glycoside hydrolase family 31 protein [Ferruginibacter sp.]